MFSPTALWTKAFWVNTFEAAGVAFVGAVLVFLIHTGTPTITVAQLEQAGEVGAVAAVYSFSKSFGVTQDQAALNTLSTLITEAEERGRVSAR